MNWTNPEFPYTALIRCKIHRLHLDNPVKYARWCDLCGEEETRVIRWLKENMGKPKSSDVNARWAYNLQLEILFREKADVALFKVFFT